MKAKKTITELRKAGWSVDEVRTQKQHYTCAGTGNMGSYEKAISYVATLPGCHYRLEFFVRLAESIEEHDEHNDIQVLHKSEKSNALGCMRFKTVKRAIETATSYSAKRSKTTQRPTWQTTESASKSSALPFRPGPAKKS